MGRLLIAIKNQIVEFSSTIVFLIIWVFRKITRRRAGISFNAALLLLLAAILLVPFAVNYTAHLLARN